MGDVIITRGNGGLGRRSPQTDMISGLVSTGVAVVGKVQLDTPYKIERIADAIALGITEVGTNRNAYEHIKEFFRMNANGTLWFILASEVATTYVQLITDFAPKLLIASGRNINQLGFAFAPATPVVDNSQLLLAIPAAQILADAEYALNGPLMIVLEGRGFSSAALFDLRAMNAPSVSVVIAQSKAFSILDAKYAALGTALGVISAAPVNVNIAWVREFNLMGGNLADWCISGAQSSAVSQTLQNSLDEKGFIFFKFHAGLPGIYFNDSHTGAEITSDYAYIENVRTMNKAVRIIRKTMLPNVNAPVLIDPVTGKLPLPVVSSYQEQVNKAVKESMLNSSEISGFNYFIDPNQNILSTSELNSEFDLIPTGTARTIRVSVQFSNPFK